MKTTFAVPVTLLLLLGATWHRGARAADPKKEDTAPTSSLTLARVEKILHVQHAQVAFFSLTVTGVPDLPPETEKH